jgi:hypothetical protein
VDPPTIENLALRDSRLACEHYGMQRFMIALGIFAAACGGPDPATVDALVIDAPGAPTLAVVASPVTIARGETVTFTVTVANFTIVNPMTGPPPKDHEGHYHYYLDDAVGYTAGWTPSITLRPTAATALGPHTMRFVLETNDHEELAPKVEATVSFTLQ